MSKTILMIDDDSNILNSIKDGLEGFGYRVRTASDGISGLKIARDISPDFIILDYYMPGGDGGWVFGRLRSIPELANIPVLFLSGQMTIDLEQKFGSVHDTYLLRKPAELGAIVAEIQNALGSDDFHA